MTRAMALGAACLSLFVAACFGPPKGDSARGEALHRDCLACHGTELYVPPQRKIATLPKLRDEVERWNDSYNPKMNAQEVEDVVIYLNLNFYKFSQ